MIRFLIYFNSNMAIAKQIMDITPEQLHVFIQDCSAWKHKNARFQFFT